MTFLKGQIVTVAHKINHIRNQQRKDDASSIKKTPAKPTETPQKADSMPEDDAKFSTSSITISGMPVTKEADKQAVPRRPNPLRRKNQRVILTLLMFKKMILINYQVLTC